MLGRFPFSHFFNTTDDLSRKKKKKKLASPAVRSLASAVYSDISASINQDVLENRLKDAKAREERLKEILAKQQRQCDRVIFPCLLQPSQRLNSSSSGQIGISFLSPLRSSDSGKRLWRRGCTVTKYTIE